MRGAQNSREHVKMQLVKGVLSGNNKVARQAIHILRNLGLLEGDTGLLQGLNFRGADLRHVNFRNANLRGADLSGAKLSKVNFWYANMEKANLSRVSIPSADLIGVDLRQALLDDAILTRANLEYADLRGANFGGADLRGVNFWQSTLTETLFDTARFDGNTIMPDGQKWSPTVDMKCFTHANHPNAWRPADYDLANMWDLMNARYRKNKKDNNGQ